MHHPFKERQYTPLSSGSLGENLHILKWKCKVPLKKTSRQAGSCPSALAPGALYLQSWWRWDWGHGEMLRDAPKDAGPGLPAVRHSLPCGRAPGEHVGTAGSANVEIRLSLALVSLPLRIPFFACSLKWATWGAFADCGASLVIFFFPYWSYKLRMS